MALKINKRQQARNEQTLQELIKGIPGNERCADCHARNPGWASWNLGIFLCMRCAALHRKLGTHVSKVKSLSMDSWSLDQVEQIKKVGNVASNRRYNPRNSKPTIPVDADEVDGAMERYIREKYLHKTLSDEKPPTSQEARHHTGSSSSSNDVPPPLPPKPGQRFGGTKRSATSPFPRTDAPLPSPPASIKTDRTGASSGGTTRMASIPETEHGSTRSSFELELRRLRNLGFHDDRKSLVVLQRHNGDLSRTLEVLVRQKDGLNEDVAEQAQTQTNGISFEKPRSRSNSGLQNGTSYGQISLTQAASTNPFASSRSVSRASSSPQQLETSFQNMQLTSSTQPQLYSTAYAGNQSGQPASYVNYDDTPMNPSPLSPHYTRANASQSVGSSPQQNFQSSFSTHNYPLRQSRSQQNFAASNPFASSVPNHVFQTMPQPQQQSHPAQSPLWPQQNRSPQFSVGFQHHQQYSAPPSTTQSTFQTNPYQQQNLSSPYVQNPILVSNNAYMLPAQQSTNDFSGHLNALNQQQQNGFQHQYYPQYNNVQQQQQQQQQQFQLHTQSQPLRPQAAGLSKASILALYNTPSPAFTQSSTASLASTSNSTDISTSNMYGQSQMQPPTFTQSPVRQSQEDVRPVPIQARSVTMPLPAATSYQNGNSEHSNNPFGKGHISRESMLFTGAGNDGRTSPDAFRGLSSQVGWTT